MSSTEDWWAVWIGLFFVLLGFIAAVSGIDLTGWIVKFSLWVDISKAFKASHQELLSPAASLIVTYVIFSVATCTGAKFMKWNVKKYFVAWSIIFWLTVVFYIVGQNAYIAATELEWKKYGIDIIALFAGLFIGNLTPKRFRSFIKEAAKPEWFIKVAIVCLGTKLGLKAIEAAGFAIDLLLAGCCATIAAYLLFWPLAYTVSRKIFKLSKEWSACLASAISICGVSASIATGAAIRARPIVPIMISSLVVVFAFSELVILPGVLTKYWSHEPIVAGASLGLTVKTDGADAAAGAILDDLIRSKVAAEGIHWDEGWILASAIMTKIWIDMFIGVWAFVLAVVWVWYIRVFHCLVPGDGFWAGRHHSFRRPQIWNETNRRFFAEVLLHAHIHEHWYCHRFQGTRQRRAGEAGCGLRNNSRIHSVADRIFPRMVISPWDDAAGSQVAKYHSFPARQKRSRLHYPLNSTIRLK